MQKSPKVTDRQRRKTYTPAFCSQAVLLVLVCPSRVKNYVWSIRLSCGPRKMAREGSRYSNSNTQGAYTLCRILFQKFTCISFNSHNSPVRKAPCPLCKWRRMTASDVPRHSQLYSFPRLVLMYTTDHLDGFLHCQDLRSFQITLYALFHFYYHLCFAGKDTEKWRA